MKLPGNSQRQILVQVLDRLDKQIVERRPSTRAVCVNAPGKNEPFTLLQCSHDARLGLVKVLVYIPKNALPDVTLLDNEKVIGKWALTPGHTYELITANGFELEIDGELVAQAASSYAVFSAWANTRKV